MVKLVLPIVRQARGLTQAELAKRMEVPQQYISRWENNKHLPTLEQLVKLADVLHCRLDDLIDWEGDKDE